VDLPVGVEDPFFFSLFFPSPFFAHAFNIFIDFRKLGREFCFCCFFFRGGPPSPPPFLFPPSDAAAATTRRRPYGSFAAMGETQCPFQLAADSSFPFFFSHCRAKIYRIS